MILDILWAAKSGTNTYDRGTALPAPAHQRTGRTCLQCTELQRVFKSANDEYRIARAASFYRVSTEIAARMQVDMERAKSALSEHVLSCTSASSIDNATYLEAPEA